LTLQRRRRGGARSGIEFQKNHLGDPAKAAMQLRRHRAGGYDPERPASYRHRRLADHPPEHVPREPTPCQVPPPELADNRPLPLAFELPDATLTLTAPPPDTLP
jgi:hypothetical protein